MLLQCPSCRLNAHIPNRLEGKAVECPRCKTVGYAGRRPGGLANLKPLPEPAETATLDGYLDHIERELTGPFSEDLCGETPRDVAFYNLPGEPLYEDMLREELAALVKKTASFSENRRPACEMEQVRRDTGLAAVNELIAAAEIGQNTAVTCAGIRNAGYAERRACPRMEAADIAIEIGNGGSRFALENISVSGAFVVGGQGGLHKGDRVRFRLVHVREETAHVSAGFLHDLGSMEARVVRADEAGAGLAFENLTGFGTRRLAGLVARLARQRNEANIPNMQEAQGF